MKSRLALAGLGLAMLPMAALTAQAKAVHPATHTKAAKHSAATLYECAKCGMKYTAKMAKKDHYKCTMDGGKLVPVKVKK
jgi:DNA-directed RNA polymerase subunit RPC12/RpoP